MISKLTRKELCDMSTQQLYDLNGEIIELSKKIECELILRGDF